MKRGFLLGLLPGLLFAAAVDLYALDYGLTLRQTVEFAGRENDGLELAFTPGLGPWLSDSSGKSTDLYLSAFINMRYTYDKLSGEGGWRPIPELGRCSLFYWLPGSLSVEFGRIRYSDPNSMIVSGLFDGVAGTLDIRNTRLTLGAFYSGLLYRDTAKIFMTAADSSWDYAAGDTSFSFAGRRLIAACGWEIPSLFESPHSLTLNALAQFDLNAAEEILNSQYLSFKFNFSPLSSVYTRAGGVLAFVESRGGAGESADINLALNLALDWALPGGPEDALSFGLVWATGEADSNANGDSLSLGPFRSVTLLSSSGTLNAGMAGLLSLRGSYTILALENLSLGLDCRYFFRGNLGVFDTLPLVADTEKRALGGEAYGSLVWVPMSDVSVVCGGGLFVPDLGNAVQTGTPPRWKTMLTLTVSF
jgi:hypothetical protein